MLIKCFPDFANFVNANHWTSMMQTDTVQTEYLPCFQQGCLEFGKNQNMKSHRKIKKKKLL